ncbi:uncharacterized protein BDR25DRAFT_348164 [Lindgomyces ingoldianus]|uniref:Uncharacterized protein n=1 Tax=Lindgomyces ingoldianus TaxID=673940 RepID=A0ACB6RHQ5_9PLEO|nr:uncharacterized protein BDR25DRAFT_348164 [Lindgomyces ingoldianus]KAF2477847.1 hypothetical protein BDR25DRAFT_348164 [Lindgomyces ingoldianus]
MNYLTTMALIIDVRDECFEELQAEGIGWDLSKSCTHLIRKPEREPRPGKPTHRPIIENSTDTGGEFPIFSRSVRLTTCRQRTYRIRNIQAAICHLDYGESLSSLDSPQSDAREECHDNLEQMNRALPKPEQTAEFPAAANHWRQASLTVEKVELPRLEFIRVNQLCYR